MALTQITYTNKETLNEQPSIADKNKVKAADMNEIKSVVNTNASNVGDLTNLNTTAKTSIVEAINELIPTTLYDNSSGETGTVNLSDSSANYNYIEIFCKDSNGVSSSTKVENPNGKNVNLMSVRIDTGVIQFYTKNVSINTNKITNIEGYTIRMQGSSINAYNNANTYILITKVIGYK